MLIFTFKGGFFVKKDITERGLFNDNPDLIEKCETCAYAVPLGYTKEFLCSKFGPVPPECRCKKYRINRFLKRPPKKREINISRYSNDDFQSNNLYMSLIFSQTHFLCAAFYTAGRNPESFFKKLLEITDIRHPHRRSNFRNRVFSALYKFTRLFHS